MKYEIPNYLRVLSTQYKCQKRHKQRGKVALLTLGDSHNDAFSSHHSIVQAWTAVPLFIKSNGTMLHLKLNVGLCAQHEIIPFCCSQISVPKQQQQQQSVLFGFQVRRSIESTASETCMWAPDASEQCYILYLSVSLSVLLKLSIYIYIYIFFFFFFCIFLECVMQFNEQTSWCLDIKKKDGKKNHGDITSVTSL